MADGYPFYLPSDARRLFVSEGVVRRVLNTARWATSAHLLELFGSAAGSMVAREVACQVTLADVDAARLAGLEEQAKNSGVSERLTVKQVSLGSLPFADGSVDGVLILGRVAMGLEQTAVTMRRLLAVRGRLVMTWPVRVGLSPAKASLDYWQQRLGQPLMLPRECLMAIEKQGYEPETVETVTDTELDEYYKGLEGLLGKLPAAERAHARALTDEIAVHRDAGNRSGVSYALMVARRKEPGERPPAARDGG